VCRTLTFPLRLPATERRAAAPASGGEADMDNLG
jgi:hypothetical protein